MREARIIRVPGRRLGLALSRDELSRLGIDRGDRVRVVESSGGLVLTPADADRTTGRWSGSAGPMPAEGPPRPVAEERTLIGGVMREDRATLRGVAE